MRSSCHDKVCARDFTHDPAGGFDSYAFAHWLAERTKGPEDRVKYIISNGQIASGQGQSYPAGQWRNYTGSNPHDHHVHVSVRHGAEHYDDARSWDWSGAEPEPEPLPENPPSGAVTMFITINGVGLYALCGSVLFTFRDLGAAGAAQGAPPKVPVLNIGDNISMVDCHEPVRRSRRPAPRRNRRVIMLNVIWSGGADASDIFFLIAAIVAGLYALLLLAVREDYPDGTRRSRSSIAALPPAAICPVALGLLAIRGPILSTKCQRTSRPTLSDAVRP